MKEACIIIPCYNEEQTIGKVIEDFKKELPHTKIVVIDNACTDKTQEIAQKAGAQIMLCPRKGKGAAMRKALREINSDFYIIVDGDDTYPAEAIHSMLELAKSGTDMVVGDRLSEGNYKKENKRPLHNLGNQLIRNSINLLFGSQLKDVLSGYRVLRKEFAKSCPILLDGFEVESEITLHAVEKLFDIKEIPVKYRDRPPGSLSKLNTLKDGSSILRVILWIFKDSKPLIFFSFLGASFLTLSALLATLQKPYLALASFFITCTCACCGLILDTLAKFQRENFEIQRLTRNFK